MNSYVTLKTLLVWHLSRVTARSRWWLRPVVRTDGRRIRRTVLPAYEDFRANRLANLPSVAAANSHVTMKTLPSGTWAG